MIYKRYSDDIDTKGQREFFDSIVGQVTRRTMSADDQGLFVEYENKQPESTYRVEIIGSESYGLALVQGYAPHHSEGMLVWMERSN